MPQRSLCLALKSLRVYSKSSPYAVVKKRMGDQRGSKVVPRCKHSTPVVGEKDEVTLITEEIRSPALAILKLCMSEGINK